MDIFPIGHNCISAYKEVGADAPEPHGSPQSPPPTTLLWTPCIRAHKSKQIASSTNEPDPVRYMSTRAVAEPSNTMFLPDGPKHSRPNGAIHYHVGLNDFRRLVKSADLGTNIAFARQLRIFFSPDKGDSQEDNSPNYARSVILIPNTPSADIALLDQILDSEACDIYHDWPDKRARSATVPRLKRVLAFEASLAKLKAPGAFATHRRAHANHTRARLNQHRHAAKKMIRRILTDVYAWHEIHRKKEDWRKKVLQKYPALADRIHFIEPPAYLSERA